MTNLLLKNARFITSSPEVSLLPDEEVPEFAFLGRSNVGKSSLINLVAGQHGLAHTSRTPGRTRLLNYFSATLQMTTQKGPDKTREERNIGIVDLPGYGFAKMSETERVRLSKVMTDYINGRPQIRATLHLVDIRRDPTAEDQSISRQLRSLEPAYILVATKTDKFGKAQRKAELVKLANAFSIAVEDIIACSVTEKFGQGEIWGRMWNFASES